MDASKIFQFANSYVLIGWVLLLAVPNWKHTFNIVRFGVVFILSLLYAYLILSTISNFNPNSFSTLANVKQLFTNDMAVLAGWVHYLAFDLLVGSYIVENSKKLGISRLIYSLILPFTFMFGPIGFVFFKIAKLIKTNLGNA